MSLATAIVQGLRQAVSSPRLVLLLWLVNLLYAVPASLMMADALAGSFDHSLASRQMLDGFDLGWHAEFESRADGFGSTFTPAVSGPGPVLDNLEAWWSGELVRVYPGLVALGAGYAALWAFLLGGTLDRMARPQGAFALERFASAGGRYLPRFVGLALISGVFYFLIYRLARLSYRWIEAASRDVTEERIVFFAVLLVSALAILLLSIVRMVFDYAKIATVIEERGNVLAGAAAGLRFVLRQPWKTFGFYLAWTVLAAAGLALYLWLAPGAGQATFTGISLAFLCGQLYLVARLVFRLTLLGGQMSLYRELRSNGS